MKKNLLSIFVGSLCLMGTNVNASEIGKFCNDIEKISSEGFGYEVYIGKTKSKMCLNLKNGKIQLKESSYIYGENNYTIKGFSEDKISSIQKLENISGKLFVTMKNGDLYSANIGYVLNNNDYLPLIKNNEITLKKENIENVKKVVYSDITLIMTKDNKAFIKTEEGNWERAPFKEVIDITYSNYGSYFILTDKGIFAKLKEKDLQKTGYKGKGQLFRFDKAGLGRIPLNSLRFDFVKNSNNDEHLSLLFTTTHSRTTYKAILIGGEAKFEKAIIDKKTERMILEEKKSGLLTQELPIVEADNIFIKEFVQVGKTFDKIEAAAFKTNYLNTKYDDIVALPYKENVLLIDRYNKWNQSYNDYSKIVSIEENLKDKTIYVLRDNKTLKIYNKNSLKMEQHYEDISSLSTNEFKTKVYLNK